MWLRVEEDVSDVHRTDAVDHGMMHLGRKHPPATLEPVDKGHLPERSGAVEAVRPEVAEPLVQLCMTARRRQSRVAHVCGEIESRIRDPCRPAQPPDARFRESRAEPWQHPEALLQQRYELLARRGCAVCSRIED